MKTQSKGCQERAKPTSGDITRTQKPGEEYMTSERCWTDVKFWLESIFQMFNDVRISHCVDVNMTTFCRRWVLFHIPHNKMRLFYVKMMLAWKTLDFGHLTMQL